MGLSVLFDVEHNSAYRIPGVVATDITWTHLIIVPNKVIVRAGTCEGRIR